MRKVLPGQPAWMDQEVKSGQAANASLPNKQQWKKEAGKEKLQSTREV